MSDVIGIIRAIVSHELQQLRSAELALVRTDYKCDPNGTGNYECDVTLRNSGLELKRVPVMAGRIGAAALPNEDDLVVVQFLQGDLHSAVITGRVYDDTDRPPEAKAKEFVYVSPDAAGSGLRRVYLEFPNGNKLLLDDDKAVLEMGKSKLTVQHDGAVEIKSADKDITLTDQNGSNKIVVAPQSSTIRIQGQTKVVVEAPQIELVENSTHPLVFGDNLLQYLTQIVTIFQSHTHPGEMALGVFPVTPMIPVPPMPMPTPDLCLSR